MIPQLLLIAAIPAIAGVIAFFEAKREKRLIDAANKAGGPDLDHGDLLVRRIGILFPIVTICAAFAFEGMRWIGTAGWLLCLVLAWSVFTFTHRWSLNRRRGFNTCYISPGNVYDMLWMRLTGCGRWWPFGIPDHRLSYSKNASYTDRTHKAGFYAYCFEALVGIFSCWGLWKLLS